MKKVVLRAPVLSQSGYGVHSRQIARWLLTRDDVELTIQPVQWGNTPWYLDATACDGLVGKMIACARDDKGPFDVSFQVQLPNEWTIGLANIDVGVTAGVETTICNPEWIKAINAIQNVVVPSTFVKSTFEATGKIDANVHVIPESFIDSLVKPVGKQLLEFETSFNFLLVGQMTSRNAESDRKNIFNTLKWFCEAFAGDRDVGLVIKTNSGRDTKIDRRVTTDVIKQTLAHVRKGEYPRIHLVHGSMTDDEIRDLYKHPSIKAFVTLTRGEGFCLPVLEAAACGLPVIATNWSGYLDFLKLGKFVKLDFELKQIPKSRIDNAIFIQDAKWADVSEQDVKDKLLKFRNKPGIPGEWAIELQQKVLHAYSHVAVAKQYDSLWEQLRTW